MKRLITYKNDNGNLVEKDADDIYGLCDHWGKLVLCNNPMDHNDLNEMTPQIEGVFKVKAKLVSKSTGVDRVAIYKTTNRAGWEHIILVAWEQHEGKTEVVALQLEAPS